MTRLARLIRAAEKALDAGRWDSPDRQATESELACHVIADKRRILSRMSKRQYSKAFTPSTRQKRRYLMVDKIPAELDIAVRAKAKREGVSLRALILGWLKEWVKP